MAFIFSSSLTELQVQQLRANCPFPLLNKNVTDVTIDGSNVFYNVTELNANSNSTVTVFRCGEGGIMTVSESVYTYSSGIFDAQQALIGYMSASMSAFFDKMVAIANTIYLIINAPAEVTAIPFFGYVNAFLFFLIGLGGFMIIRGN